MFYSSPRLPDWPNQRQILQKRALIPTRFVVHIFGSTAWGWLTNNSRVYPTSTEYKKDKCWIVNVSFWKKNKLKDSSGARFMQTQNAVQPSQTYGKNEPTSKESSTLAHPDSCTLLKLFWINLIWTHQLRPLHINTALFCSIFFPSSNLAPHLESVPPQLMDGTYQTKLRSQLRLCVPCLTLCFAVFLICRY